MATMLLKVLVALQDHLHAARHLVVLLAHGFRGQRLGGGGQRIHRGEQALGGQRTFQHHRGIQVGEGGGGSGVRQVVRRDMNEPAWM